MLFLITLSFLHASPVPQSSVFSTRIKADVIEAIAPGSAPSDAPGSPAPVALIKPTAGAVLIKAESSSDPATRARIRAEQRHRDLWLGLTIAQHSAAAFDAYATRQSISSGSSGGVRELNPMLRPFAGNSSIYVAIQVAPAVLVLRRSTDDDQPPWLDEGHLVDTASSRYCRIAGKRSARYERPWGRFSSRATAESANPHCPSGRVLTALRLKWRTLPHLRRGFFQRKLAPAPVRNWGQMPAAKSLRHRFSGTDGR